jgi:hypothetical protein
LDKPRIFVGSTGVRGVYLGVPLAPGLRMGYVDVEPPPRRPLRDDRARTRTECSKKSRR